jgi:hypothetical protein
VHELSARRITSVAAIAMGLLAAGHGEASAVCSTRHLTRFELHDTATLVAVVSVTKAPRPSTSGPVELVIHEQLKGTPARTAKARENGACTAGFYNVLVGKVARTALVFVGANGEAVGYWSGVVDAPSAATLTAMRDWSNAASGQARAEVLVTAMESGDKELGADAAYYLADDPALVLALTAAQVDRVAALTGNPDHWGAEIILTRLRGTHLAALRTQAGFARDLRAMVAFDFERITSAAELSRIIERDRAPRSFKRVAALERCERVHGRRLERFSIYNSRYPDRTRWRALARACRTGTPAVPVM